MSGFPHIHEGYKSADNSPSSSSSFSTMPSPSNKVRRVPFSWEKEPGVPKHQSTTSRIRSFSCSDQEDCCHHPQPDHQLPPPPKFGKGVPKKIERERERKEGHDPFVAAMKKVTKEEKSTYSKSKSWISIFTVMGTCSSSENQVSLPGPKLYPREPSKGVRPNQVLDDHRLKNHGSLQVLGGSLL